MKEKRRAWRVARRALRLSLYNITGQVFVFSSKGGSSIGKKFQKYFTAEIAETAEFF